MNLNDKKIESENKINYFKHAKQEVINNAEKLGIQRIDSFISFKNKIIKKYNNYQSNDYHIKFVKKIFNISNQKIKGNIVDQLLFDGIEKDQCLKIKGDFFKLLELINPDLIKNVPPLDICLYLSDKSNAYSLREKNMIVVSFSSFDAQFIVKQLVHEYIHFIEFYNPEFADKNLQLIIRNSQNKKRNCNIRGENFEIFDLDQTYDDWSGYVYPDNHTEIVSTEIMYLFSDPVDALFTKSDFFQYLNEIKFFNN